MSTRRPQRKHAPAFLVAFALLLARGGYAHTFEPCLLAISERAAGEYDVLWRPPGRASGYNLSSFDIEPVFAASCQATPAVRAASDDASATAVWRLRCAGNGLRGSTLRVPGIDGTQLDVVVRVAWLDQRADTTVLRSGASSYTFADLPPSYLQAATRYVRLGVEHILFGWDHLTFVLGLFLLVTSGPVLVKTITAFTLGHSLTLALAAFRLLALPTPLTEALIALSIACIARELLGDPATPPTITRARPWLVAAAFGLLHGLGFAAALDDLGFQRATALPALVGFNLGVELGQIAFVAALLVVARVLQPLSRLPGAALALPYAIGSLAFVWLFERVLRFWSLPA